MTHGYFISSQVLYILTGTAYSYTGCICLKNKHINFHNRLSENLRIFHIFVENWINFAEITVFS